MSWISAFLRRKSEGPAASASPEREALDDLLRTGYDAAVRGDLSEAQRLYRELLELDPDDVEALYFLGVIAIAEGREIEASDLLRKAVDLRPTDAGAWMALGIAHHHQRRLEEAAEAFRAGLALQPENASLRNNLSGTLIELGSGDQARLEMERLLQSGFESAQLLCNLGHVYRDQARVDDALEIFRRALKIAPNNAEVFTNYLLTLNYSDQCDASEIFSEHLSYGARFVKPYVDVAPEPAWPRRLRIGYVSPDFRNHVVAVFVEPILAHRDRSRFEVSCYYNHRWEDRVTERFRELADHWIPCVHMSDAELAERIRQDRIDILVDLTGHTGDNRLLLFAAKPAPLQVSYLGYPNTTGLSAVDYRITDERADPPGTERYSVEKLLRPWPTYFCYRPPQDCPAVAPSPAGASGPVTFGCFNNLPKISTSFLDAAARVLAAVPGSRLKLKSRPLGISHVAERLRERFVRAGIDPARVELRGWEETAQHHLAMYGSVDIALDSFPYNGATTTCEALWMGVPVVSVAGDRHAGRMGSSLLGAVGLPELVAKDVDQYVEICATLAGDRARLAEQRAGLRERVKRSPLLDETGFVSALEASYIDIWQRKLQPESALGFVDAKAIPEKLKRATELRLAGERLQSEELCKEILRAKPDHEEALNLLWDLSYETGNHGVAVEWLRRGIAANDKLARLHYMLGYSLLRHGNAGDAVASFHRAVTLDPGMAKGYNNLGAALHALGQLEPAEQCYRRAIELDADLADGLYNLGNLLRQTGRFDEAVRYIQKAIQLDDARADWKCNLGDLLFHRLRLDDALKAYDAALALDPQYSDAYVGRAATRQELGQAAQADADLRKAMSLKPDDARIHSQWLLGLHYEEGNDAALLLKQHREWAKRHTGRIGRQAARAPRERSPNRRLNVGYVSGDFKRHSVASFIQPVLAAHDRARFRIFCYSNVVFEDVVTRQIRETAESWRDISALSDEFAAERIRADRIDLLVDLSGHTGDGRILLFAHKPAPVQASWLGYPGTTGLAAIDYRLTDSVADPEGSDADYVERLVRLPGGFLCYGPPAQAPEVGALPSLTRGRITFGCFNHLPKLTDETIALWARLLRSAPDSRLLLKSFGLSAASARPTLQNKFAEHGIAAERLELCAPEDSFSGHLEKYGEIDIALDVFPYNGVTTTCEALWMGVPVVTMRGGVHVSRVASSILTRVGLPELIADTPDAYLSIALQLSRDVERLRALRATLRERMRASPLLDAQGFTRALESAYLGMMERWREEQAAEDARMPATAS